MNIRRVFTVMFLTPLLIRSGIVSRSLSMRIKKSSEMRSMAPQYIPKTPNQVSYVQYLNDQNTPIVFGIGPAGTGKTLLACSTAIQDMKRGTIQKIVLTRPVVTVEEEIGFLPGNINHKMDPWTRPIFDIFLEYYNQKDIDSMIHAGVIEIAPLAFMRGRTFKKCFIIADEMQNSSPNQMLMLTTRIGHGSKMVITGDLNQSDRMTENGLQVFIRKIKKYKGDSQGIHICELEKEDIERSPIVSKIIDIYSDVPVLPMTHNVTTAVKTNITNFYWNGDGGGDAALIPKSHISKF
jgi:phosphate starvation-inducible PhoH-like protein